MGRRKGKTRPPRERRPEDRAGAPVAPSRPRPPIPLWLVFVSSFAFFALWSPARIAPGDSWYLYNTAKSLVTKGSLAITPPRDYHEGEFENVVKAPSGAYYTHWGLTQSLLEVPFILIDRAVQPALDAPNDKKAVWVAVLHLLPATTSAATCVAFFLIVALLGVRPRYGLAATAALALATTVWPYSQSMMTETTLTALLVWSVAAALGYRQSQKPGWLLLLGVMLGLQLNVKVVTVLWWGPLVGYLWWYARGREGVWRHSLCLLPGVVAGTLLLAWHNHLRYGGVFELGFAAGRNVFGFDVSLLTGLWGLLLSPDKSLFVYAPILLLSLAAIRSFAREHRGEALLVLALFAPWLLLHAMWHDFPGGWGWGPRFLVPLVPLLLLPAVTRLGDWRAWARWRRLAVAAVLLLSLGVQLLGVLVEPSDYLSERSGFTPQLMPHVKQMEGDYQKARVKHGTVYYGPSISHLAGQVWVLKHALGASDPWADFPPRKVVRPLERTIAKDKTFDLSPWPLASLGLSGTGRVVNGARLLLLLALLGFCLWQMHRRLDAAEEAGPAAAA